MNWKPILILLCVFLTGTVSGVFIAIPLFQKDIEARISSEQIAPKQLRRFSQRLKLTPEQVEMVNPVIQKHSSELRQARAEAHRETLDILTRMEDGIAKYLNPQQLEVLKTMQAEESKRVQKLRENLSKPQQTSVKKDPSKRALQKKEKAKKDGVKKNPNKKENRKKNKETSPLRWIETP